MNDTFLIDKSETNMLNSKVDFIPCECNHCQHYYRYIKDLIPEAKFYFEEIGINLSKCQELWCYLPDDNGYNHYSGYFKVAVKETVIMNQYSVSKRWKSLEYGKCYFRIRLEYDKDGDTILGFEADLPSEPILA